MMYHHQMSRLPIPILLASMITLAGCVAAPRRAAADPVYRAQQTATPTNLKNLDVAVVLTPNSRTAMDYVKRFGERRAAMASDAHAGRLFTDLLAVFSGRFGRFRVLETEGAPIEGAEIVATMDVYAAFANSIFGREKIDLTVGLSTSDGQRLDGFESRVKKGASASSVADAVTETVSNLASFLAGSQPLAAKAALARPRPAAKAPLAAAAASPMGPPAAPSRGVSHEELAQILAAAMKSAQAPAPAASRESGLPSSPVPSFAALERPNDLAIVVGIESYSEIATKAPYAERDADAFKAHVRALGVPERNIVLLKGPKAGRAALVKNLEQWLPRVAKADSRVYFYFSGHGAPDVKTGRAYLVPWDGDPSFLESTAYPVAELYRKLGELPAAQVLVAMDSCFSGAGGRSVLASGARPLVTVIETGDVPVKITVLAASASNEISGSLDDRGHGAFTYFLLKGLEAGRTTPKALVDYLSPRVQDEARRLNRDQTPQLIGDGSWSLR